MKYVISCAFFAASIVFAGCPIQRICAGSSTGGPSETFDTQCNNVPCGWNVVGGNDGDATSVSTIHEGERGIALSGTDILVANQNVGPTSLFGSTDMSVTISARCDVGSFLVLGVKLFAPNHTADAAPVAIYDLSLHPLASWGSAQTLTMNPQLTGGADSGGMDTTVTIQKLGDGQCEIDDLTFIGGFGFGFCE